MTMTTNSIESRDAAYHLHAFTDARRHLDGGCLAIERGEGVYVYDTDGKKYFEALSGLWSVALGFGERRLIDAAVRQMEKLPYYHTFNSRTHGPAAELAEKLVTMAPVPMSKAFFANSGSEAVDSAIRMIWYRSNALGQPRRKKIIARQRAYHGVTVAAASLTGLPNMHKSFDVPLPGFLHTTCPHHWREAAQGESEEQFATRLASDLERLILEEGPETVAAFVAEPLMGAGGVIVPPKSYWQKIEAVLRRFDILLVADEVICGFGRTGRMFATQTFDIHPDMIVLSKQLSSSYLPISALLLNDRVFGPLADETNRIGTFGHGFTCGGHPAAAAVALESIRIIEERSLVAHAAEVGARFRAGLAELSTHPLVGEVRGEGFIAAVELVVDKAAKRALEQPGKLGALAADHLRDIGVLTRAAADALVFCPPLVTSRQEADWLLGAVQEALDRTAKIVFHR